MRVLSGIQPTGRPHWGNYFGAIRQYIDLQNEDESYYFIANLHALTTVRDAKLLASYTLDAAIDLLALGLDPTRATLFIQSDVPEVSELCWLLLTGMFVTVPAILMLPRTQIALDVEHIKRSATSVVADGIDRKAPPATAWEQK